MGDWIRAPNITSDPATYELENEALLRDGRLDEALYEIAPWDDRTLVDVGCGTGFWLPIYSRLAGSVIGVEPDPTLLAVGSTRSLAANVEIRRGSAEHLPVADGTAHVVHARFAYFFGPWADPGLAEVARVLAPGGVFLAVDNSWSGGDFARLLHAEDDGDAPLDPNDTDRWWADRGARRHEVHGGWQASSTQELERILRIEFTDRVVDDFMATHTSPSLSYRFAVYEWRPHGQH